MADAMKVAIIGASGYSGAELAALLLKHPGVRLDTLMTANQERQGAKTQKYAEELPRFSRRCDLEVEPLNMGALVERQTHTVFLATPNETSHDLVPELLERQLRVIDLSGAYRLRQPDLYPKWYGFAHHFPALLEAAVYGLTEINRARVRQASLLANPGCYPTSALLPLVPLQRAGLIDGTFDIICDSKSGVSGAGKSPTAGTHFSEVTESFKAYNVFKHRHTPEIWQELDSSHLVFTPHLLPINRGILSTIYVRVRESVTEAAIGECFQQAYAQEPFVRLFPAGSLPEIKFVAHTNYCDVGWRLEPSRSMLVIVSAIDNLVKGAAGQAVQNMNVMLGLEETAGLM
ncbi:MAG: N-acetyl-gamma-glutamyl-phosphate reductase [Acidobacteria bacterium]|nr:N-acetyl-gamma-glutamyl-phosphate reductase [Acidobacteriota bacterium]MCI0625390.1 N-acetyl-gamma-glutamyl-phosphate reductase [Acidobacteriota bacterium]MCI0721033.1 N-acetyl-gamma-glutamyl-phosphate reductase [Acidobacteriota bacterium]